MRATERISSRQNRRSELRDVARRAGGKCRPVGQPVARPSMRDVAARRGGRRQCRTQSALLQRVLNQAVERRLRFGSEAVAHAARHEQGTGAIGGGYRAKPERSAFCHATNYISAKYSLQASRSAPSGPGTAKSAPRSRQSTRTSSRRRLYQSRDAGAVGPVAADAARFVGAPARPRATARARWHSRPRSPRGGAASRDLS